MSQSHNPFVVGKPVPPEQFVGRESLIGAAFDQIHNRSYLAIWGGSGMGKTSFMELLTSPQVWKKHGLDPSQAVIVRLSCENIIPFTPSGFWREVLSLLKDKLDNQFALPDKIESFLNKGETTKDSLRLVLRQLGAQRKFLVLLVNDYDTALYTNEQYTETDREVFLSECRNLAVHSQESEYLSMIVASLKRLSTLGPQINLIKSPWYNHYLFQCLKPFTDQEVDELLQPLGKQMTPELRNAIREIAGGHPTLLQIAGFLLYRELRTGKVPDFQAFTSDFETNTTHIFQNMWERCSEEEQSLLMLIALSGLQGRLHKKKQFDLSNIDIIFSQRDQELKSLEEQGVIIRSLRQETLYSLTSSIMERWVIQEVWNTNEASLQNRQRVFLNLMSRQQTEKVTNAIRWVGQHKNDVPSALEWIRQVVDVLFKFFGG